MASSTLKNVLMACPNCFGAEIRVIGTYYTEDNEIVRQRTCLDCKHKWNTVQPIEKTLPPSVKVLYPTWRGEEGKLKLVELVDIAATA